MYARAEKIFVTCHIRYKDSRDSIVGTDMVIINALKGIERCHKASTEIIINAAAIRINGAKIVL